MFKFKNRAYTSDIDKFLREFDEKHPHKSAAQQAEIDKAARVSTARDNLHAVDNSKKDA